MKIEEDIFMTAAILSLQNLVPQNLCWIKLRPLRWPSDVYNVRFRLLPCCSGQWSYKRHYFGFFKAQEKYHRKTACKILVGQKEEKLHTRLLQP
jgi:hypothetical protein